MKIKGSVTFALFLLSLCLFFGALSLKYKGLAGFVPLAFAVPTAALILIVLVGEWFPSVTRYFEVGLEDLLSEAAIEREDPPFSSEQLEDMAPVVKTFAWFLAFGVVLFIAGFYVAAALFALSFMRFQGKIGWPACVTVTLFMEAFYYVLFEQLLNVNLFKGILLGGSFPPL